MAAVHFSEALPYRLAMDEFVTVLDRMMLQEVDITLRFSKYRSLARGSAKNLPQAPIKVYTSRTHDKLAVYKRYDLYAFSISSSTLVYQ
jgi:hypothetical protein